MRIHSFLLTITLVLLANLVASAQDRQLIKVSTYQIKSEEKAKLFDEMMAAAIDALNDYGVKNVGVFQLADAESNKDYPHLRVTVVPFDSADKMLKMGDAFTSGPNFWQDAQEYLSLEQDDKAFDRIDSTLLQAFTGMPKLAVPKGGENRLFELRVYESYSELTGVIKVQMFNDGEIELFEKVGLPAIFYGEAIAGGNLPQLTYMLAHDSTEAQKAGWQKFIRSPEWASLQKQEPYAGRKLVSKIKKTMLVATSYSQIK